MALRILWTIVRGVWIAAMVAAPLFGFWLASSLAAYNNASQWLALLVGLALFPIVPVAWEAFASWRRSRKKATRPPILTRLDRLVLRTLIINGAFLIGMLGFARQTALRAVAMRGDWMFDGFDGGAADTLRGWLLGRADRLESHHQAQHFGTSDKAPEPTPQPEPTKQPEPTAAPAEKPTWPMPEEVSSWVAEMPADAQASIDTVGAYLESHFPDPRERVKAIHDYVVLRLSYDEGTLNKLMAGDNDVPPQDAEHVFEARTGVCEGYARLMVALGKASGVSIAYIAGSIRDARRRVLDGDDATVKAALEGYGHAWNAVMLDGKWELIDATWDDPTGAPPSDGTKVRSTYLFTPPELMVYNHLPDDPNWQLLPAPLSTGDFVREPMMEPDMGRYDLGLLDPTRAQVSVDGEITITLHNPKGAHLMAFARVDGSAGRGDECNASATKITCKLGHGEYEVQLFAAARQYGEHDYIGSVLANSR